ncbi:MAG: EamA family transporter, partial [Alphaproteobacteria bacterium]|nr:EamA family transporter [Alphaproteobacteria bacterium]
GALNFTLFWWLLFESAYLLPGGVAGTVGAVQPFVVIFLSRLFLGQPIRFMSVLASIAGVAGIALMVISPSASFSEWGIIAGILGAMSMAFGTVLSRKWQTNVSPLTSTAWQLTAGGILLVPLALGTEGLLQTVTVENVIGYGYLGLIGGAFTYLLWFFGISRLPSFQVSILILLSPTVAVILGWVLLGESLSVVQMVGFAIVLLSVVGGQASQMLKRKSELSSNLATVKQ